MLVNCAGTSVTGKFEDIEVNCFEVSEHAFFFKFYHMIFFKILSYDFFFSTILTISLHSCDFAGFLRIVIHLICGSCQN